MSIENILKLFKSVIIPNLSNLEKKKSSDMEILLNKSIKYGFIFDEIIYNLYSNEDIEKLVMLVKNNMYISPDQLNSSFHKSWDSIRTKSNDELHMEQILHYITTYGFESLKIYDENYVFIPKEELNIPSLTKNIKLTLIHGITKDQIQEKIIELIYSGVALKQDTITQIVSCILDLQLNINLDLIKNKEIKCVLYRNLNIIPSDPTEFIRYIIYICSYQTLIIKNQELISLIKSNINIMDINSILTLFEKYSKQFGLIGLASIFYRYKPLFLAFKSTNNNDPYARALNNIINRIRKLAVKNHKPMKEDYFTGFTKNILNKSFNEYKREFQKNLLYINVFRKIRLAYCLQFQLTECNSIVYKIRNGKAFATSYEPKQSNKNNLNLYFNLLLESIINDIAKNVQGKKVYLEEGVILGLPSSEKSFIENIPYGTSLILSNKIILGILWNNLENKRVDLDFSMIGINKFGWDGFQRGMNIDSSAEILYSGDMTTAPLPNGACEAFYINSIINDRFILMLNYFNKENETKIVPFRLFISSTNNTFKKERFHMVNHLKNQNYIVDPNLIQYSIPCSINVKQKQLGFIETTNENIKLYFGEFDMGNSRTSKNSEWMKYSKEYMIHSFSNTISLNELLLKSGAIFVSNKEDADINLSISDLQKDSILQLFK